MTYLIINYLTTAAVVVFVSEFAKANDKLVGFVTPLPLVTILTLIWLYVEHQSSTKISNHAYYIFWYGLPTLPMFLLFAYLLPKLGFWLTLITCVVFILAIFYVYVHLIKQFGIHLF